MASQFADGPTPLPVNLTEEEKVTPPDDDPVPSSSGVTAKEEAAATATGEEAAAAGELQTNGASAEAEETSIEGAKNSNTNNGDDDGNNAAATAAASFECNICLDVARDAVISMCGHLFCWPCLHTWLETRPHRQICPVCKAGIGRDKVVPIYGRSDSNPKDPRDKPLPPRPRGQRPEPETVGGIGSGGGFAGLAGGGAGGGSMFQMSFGIGAFPFGLFTTNINMGGGGGEHPFGAAARMTTNQEPSVQLEEEQFLHKAFLWVAFAFIFWLLIA